MTDTDTKYISTSQQLLISVVGILSQHVLKPVAIADITAALDGASRDQVFRVLKNLEAGGWAEQRVSGWMLSPAITKISEQVRLAIGELHHTYLDVDKNKLGRGGGRGYSWIETPHSKK